MAFRLLLVLLTLLFWTGPAHAYMSLAKRPGGCDGYTDMPRSSAFDMVARADAIIVAEAGATAPPIPDVQDADYRAPHISLRRLRALKGEGPDRFDLELGFFTGGPAGADRVNACLPFQPVRGGRYVLFLSRAADGNWRILPASGADVAAPYGGQRSRWTRLIEDYVALLKAPPEAAQQGLEAALRRDLIPGADADRQWRARHALDHLTGAFPSMPTAHLLRLVADAEQGRPSLWGGRPDRTSDWPELAWSDFDNRPWAKLLAGTGIEVGAAKPERRREQALLALTTGHHPAATPFFLERAARERSMDNAGWAVRYLALQGRREEALDLLLRDFAAFAYPFSDWRLLNVAQQMGRAMQGRIGPDRRSEAWLHDPAVADRWPQIVLSFHRQLGVDEWSLPLLEAQLGRDSDYAPADFDADSSMTQALALTGNRSVRDWVARQALDFLAWRASPPVPEQPFRPHFPPYDFTLIFSVLVMLDDWPRLRPVAQRLWCEDKAARELLVQRAGMEGRDPAILADLMASLDPADAEVRTEMMRAVVDFHGRSLYGRTLRRPGDYGAIPPELVDFRLLRDLMAGSKGPGRPFACPATPPAANGAP